MNNNSNCLPRNRALTKLAILGAGLACGPAMAQVSGAIFTTDADNKVNVNIYDSKQDVYLNGGPPPNAPCDSAGLPDGDYYFMVTSPSGQVNLSEGTPGDAIHNRKFTVAGGLIVGVNSHFSKAGKCSGSLAVQLYPYEDTPNNGGVYKAWATPQGDYTPGSGVHGFMHSKSKTDNFKVKRTPPDPETANLDVYKFYDANANGLWEGSESPIQGWPMALMPPDPALIKKTDADGLAQFGGLDPGTYSVTEGNPGGNWVHSATLLDDVKQLYEGNPVNPVSGIVLEQGDSRTVEFGNYCAVGSGGHTLGFWSNKNGEKKFDSGDLAAMNALNLRNANGSHFNPASYSAFRTWILSATASNMAYMLSAQMAAMKLNVREGFVSAAAYYPGSQSTVGELLDDANLILSDGVCGTTCDTTSPHALREDQAAIKTWLDDLNNGAGVVSGNPAQDCPFPADF